MCPDITVEFIAEWYFSRVLESGDGETAYTSSCVPVGLLACTNPAAEKMIQKNTALLSYLFTRPVLASLSSRGAI
jgi:hypothetical protein